MKKMWVALVVTNGLWAGWAIAQQSAPTVITVGGIPVSPHPRILAMSSTDPDGMSTIIRTDKDGYVICSSEEKPEK